MARLGSWIEPFPEGIYVKPADAWIDPSQPKERSLVTHGHADHARGGHGQVWATPETLASMDRRYGAPPASRGRARWSRTAMPIMRAAVMGRCGQRPNPSQSWTAATDRSRPIRWL